MKNKNDNIEVLENLHLVLSFYYIYYYAKTTFNLFVYFIYVFFLTSIVYKACESFDIQAVLCILCHIAQYYAILCKTMQYYAILCHIVPYCAILCHIMQLYAICSLLCILCHIVPYCAILCETMP